MFDDSQAPHVVWVMNAPPDRLDIATWTDTTRELRNLGWRVTLLTAGREGPHVVNGVETHGLGGSRAYLARQLDFNKAASEYIHERWSDIDVVLFHQMSAPMLLSLWWRRLRQHDDEGPLLIMDTRDIGVPDGRLKTLLRLAYMEVERQVVNVLADGHTTITERMARLVHVPRRKYYGTWPSGVNLDLFYPAQEQHDWPGPEGPVRLVYIGCMPPERKLMCLCLAVEQANALGMSFALDLIGSGSERERLSDFAASTKGRVRVHPPVPHEEIVDWLARAHVGANPLPNARMFEGNSPIKIFEYMAAGLPVLLTRIPCHTDVLDDEDFVFWGGDGTVDDLVEGLKEVWARRADLASLGEQAAAASHNWTWHAAAEQLQAALQRALGAHGRHAPAREVREPVESIDRTS